MGFDLVLHENCKNDFLREKIVVNALSRNIERKQVTKNIDKVELFFLFFKLSAKLE